MEAIYFLPALLGVVWSAAVLFVGRADNRRLMAALAMEQARVTDLLRLLEAKAAPAEYAAYMDPAPLLPEINEHYVYSDDGLLVSSLPDEGAV